MAEDAIPSAITAAHDAAADAAGDAAALELVRGICSGWPEVEEAVLQDRPLFRVRRRRFAIVNASLAPPRLRWQAFGRSIHFLADRADLDALAQDVRFERSPHHGDHGWFALRLDRGPIDEDELAELLESAYRRAAGRALSQLLDDTTEASAPGIVIDDPDA